MYVIYNTLIVKCRVLLLTQTAPDDISDTVRDTLHMTYYILVRLHVFSALLIPCFNWFCSQMRLRKLRPPRC